MQFPIKKPVISLVGPTAIGKTELSLLLAEKFNCEIVSLDSMQVYRFMDIGTAKASEAERNRVPHHLIDIVDPDQHYDANRYVNDAYSAIQKIHERNHIPLLTGGTGLYLRSLIEGLFDCTGQFPEIRHQLQQKLVQYGSSKLHEELVLVDQDMAKKIHENDTHRLIRALEIYYATGSTWTNHIREQKQTRETRFNNFLSIGITCNREILYQRINQRTTEMLSSGLKEEVHGLLAKGYHRDLKSMQSIGYRHMACHLLDDWSIEETERLLARDTRRYAKRQFTWFNKMSIGWCDVSEKSHIFSTIENFLKKC